MTLHILPDLIQTRLPGSELQIQPRSERTNGLSPYDAGWLGPTETTSVICGSESAGIEARTTKETMHCNQSHVPKGLLAGLFFAITLTLLTGCVARQVGKIHGDFRDILLRLNEDQIMDNLIRAKERKLPLHIDYTKVDGVVTAKTEWKFGGSQTNTSGAMTDKFDYSGLFNNEHRLTVLGLPVIEYPAVYRAYLDFVSDKKKRFRRLDQEEFLASCEELTKSKSNDCRQAWDESVSFVLERKSCADGPRAEFCKKCSSDWREICEAACICTEDSEGKLICDPEPAKSDKGDLRPHLSAWRGSTLYWIPGEYRNDYLVLAIQVTVRGKHPSDVAAKPSLTGQKFDRKIKHIVGSARDVSPRGPDISISIKVDENATIKNAKIKSATIKLAGEDPYQGEEGYQIKTLPSAGGTLKLDGVEVRGPIEVTQAQIDANKLTFDLTPKWTGRTSFAFQVKKTSKNRTFAVYAGVDVDKLKMWELDIVLDDAIPNDNGTLSLTIKGQLRELQVRRNIDVSPGDPTAKFRIRYTQEADGYSAVPLSPEQLTVELTKATSVTITLDHTWGDRRPSPEERLLKDLIDEVRQDRN